MAESFLIRDVFGPNVVRKIADDIKNQYKPFDKKGFLTSILPKLDEQTYGERKESITDALIAYLPKNFEDSVKLLLKITPPPYKGEATSDTLGRFYLSTFTAYVAKMGLDSYDISLNALYEMTKSFTSEWDIRPFLLKYPDKTLGCLKEWVKDKNMHVRRLVSEGSRPNLPWGKKLKFIDENPENTTLPILSLLQDDDAEYVRRSVANHLNDLAKNNADLVVKTLTLWQKNNLTPEKEKMIHHALRTLVKQGHSGALALIGYGNDIDIDINIKSIIPNVKWGEKFEFEFSLKNNKKTAQRLLIDFIIGFQKKEGKINNKVFKLKKIELPPNSEITIRKSHSFKPITTRIYYPGLHILHIQVNGQIMSETSFMLLKP